MQERIRLDILILEDLEDDAELLLDLLAADDFEVNAQRVDNREDYLHHLKADLDVILADYALPQFDALTALELLQERGLDIPLMIVSGTIGEETAVQCMKRGAADYLLKDRLGRLGQAIRSVLREKELRQQKRQALEALRESEDRYRRLIEHSPEPIAVHAAGKFVYANPAAVRLLGAKCSEEIVGKAVLPLMHETSREAAIQRIKHMQETGQAVPPIEEKIIQLDGRVIDVELAAVPIMYEGQPAIQIAGRDITARKQAEKALAEERNLLRAILEAIPHYVYAKDQQGRFILANSAVAQAAGLASPDELLGKTDFDFFRHELAAEYYAEEQTIIRTGRPLINKDESFTDRLGNRQWILTTKAPRRDGEGRIVGIVGIGRDITERIQLEQETRRHYEQAQRRLNRLQALHTIDQAIIARSELPKSLETLLEQVIAQMGIDAASVLLLDPETEELRYAAGRGFHSESIGQTRLRLGEGYSGRTALERRPIYLPRLAEVADIAQVSLLIREEFASYFGVPLIANEQLIGVLNLFHRTPLDPEPEWLDFLESLAAQAAIAIDHASLLVETNRLLEQTQAQAQQVQQIIDSVPEGMLLLDSQHRIILANPVAQRYLPLLTGANVGEVLTHLAEEPLEKFLIPVEPGSVWPDLIIEETGQIFQVAAEPLQEGPQAGGWVLVVYDATEERLRQQQAQGQERLATVGQLAAGIAHDFNNILGIITLYSDLLRHNPDQPANEHYLATIHKQANHASSLVRQILDFSRQSVMARGRIELLSFMKEMARMLQRVLPETIAIRLHYEPGMYFVEADPARLQEALMNLAVNARDAMPEGGELQIALSSLELQPGQSPPMPELTPGAWLRLTIRDTGSGIPARVLPRIFEPFFTSKQPGKGTGLGLAQVYGIVKQHGGEIDVVSRIGHGTTFTIYLPVAMDSQADEGQQDDAEALSIASRNEVIMVVEDAEAPRQAIRKTLEFIGYQVIEVSSARQALAELESGRAIDLVLSDVVMPEMSGVQLCRVLMSQRPEVKFLLMTGYPLENRDKTFLESKSVDWMAKPFTLDALARKVRELIGDAEAETPNG